MSKPTVCSEPAGDRLDAASLHEDQALMLTTTDTTKAAVLSSPSSSSSSPQVPTTASIRVVYIDSPKIVTTDVANFRSIVQQLTGKPTNAKSCAPHHNHISKIANPSKEQQEEEHEQSAHVIAGATKVILENNTSIPHNGHLCVMKEITESTSSIGQGKDPLIGSTKVFPKGKILIPHFQNGPPLAINGDPILCTSSMQQQKGTLFNDQHEFEALFLPTINLKPPPISSNPWVCGKPQLETFFSNDLSSFSNLSSTCKDFPIGIDTHSFSDQDILAGLVSNEEPLPDVTMLPPLVEEQLDLQHNNHASDQSHPDTKILPHWKTCNSLQL